MQLSSIELKNEFSDSVALANAFSTYQLAIDKVPAYRAFIRDCGVDPSSIASIADFSRLPVMTKKNYLTAYPLFDLLIDGVPDAATIISMSSGSSGQPFYWFRGRKSVDQSIIILDDLLTNTFKTKERQTLAIVAFAMGTWIAGTYMISAMEGLKSRGHKITTITPGINTAEILRIIEQIGGNFQQLLIMGYPPFVKDLVDSAVAGGVDWRKFDLKFLLAGENISERWRDYVLERIDRPLEHARILLMYGTADAGIMGVESPVSIKLRRLIEATNRVRERLFPGSSLLPTLVHYHPTIRYVELVDGQLVFTISNALPLVRYNLLDYGRLLTAVDIIKELETSGTNDPELEAIASSRALPLIALYGRPDVAATFYALNIYPENVKYGLEKPEFNNLVSGKFVIRTECDEQTQEQRLKILIELSHGQRVAKAQISQICDAVIESMKVNNSEFNKLSQEIGKKALPQFQFLPNGSPEFTIGIKHRWVSKD